MVAKQRYLASGHQSETCTLKGFALLIPRPRYRYRYYNALRNANYMLIIGC